MMVVQLPVATAFASASAAASATGAPVQRHAPRFEPSELHALDLAQLLSPEQVWEPPASQTIVGVEAGGDDPLDEQPVHGMRTEASP
jgi:hypothetical protein